MALIAGYFDEIGFFESICKDFKWDGNDLIVTFEKGIDVGGSVHPLADSLTTNQPCRLIFKGVVESKLKVSKLISQPNKFDVHYFEKEGLPYKEPNIKYEDFYIEGTMEAIEPQGWFTWNIVAKTIVLDDLK